MKITKPTLLLDQKKCLANIEMMVRKANKHNLRFRPHFKTHQSAEIGGWFKEFGVTHITVSSVDMANYFAEQGWDNILIAFPINPLQFEEIEAINPNVHLDLLLSDTGVLPFLHQLKREVGVFIEFDAGYGRTGFSIDHPSQVEDSLTCIKNLNTLSFSGFYAHNGHSYAAKSKTEITAIHNKSLKLFRKLRSTYGQEFPSMRIIMGDTPSCSLMDHFQYVDEIGPGNFIFYDLTQEKIGSCGYQQIALAVTCPVVAKNREKSEVVIYGGAAHFSKDSLMEADKTVFGKVVEWDKNGKMEWGLPINDAYVTGLSQEHGKVKLPEEKFDQVKVGDVIAVLPVHSCLTSNLIKNYLTLDSRNITRM